jgi:hypothetical protein
MNKRTGIAIYIMAKKSPAVFNTDCRLLKLPPSISTANKKIAVRNPKEMRTNLFSINLFIINSLPVKLSVMQGYATMQRELFLELKGAYVTEALVLAYLVIIGVLATIFTKRAL